MDMKELSAASGEAPRQIRYLISKGVVPEPEGRSRGARYGETHLLALKTYAELKDRDIRSHEAVRAAIAASASGIHDIGHGVELRIPTGAVRGSDIESILQRARECLTANTRD